MPGPAPKHPERRQRTNSTASGTVVHFRPSDTPDVPAPPPDLLPETCRLWDQFWASPLAQIVEPQTDSAAIARLFTLYDERERAYRAYRSERLTTGSTGQLVLNPMGRIMHDFDAEIRQMEDRLGMTPKARLQLGITMGEAARSLSDLNRLLNDNSDRRETDIIDPRLR